MGVGGASTAPLFELGDIVMGTTTTANGFATEVAVRVIKLLSRLPKLSGADADAV